MLYEFNGKIYIKPFSNRLVEVEIIKDDEGEYTAKVTNKIISITSKMKNKISSITLKDAYKKINKSSRKTKQHFNTI